MKIKLIVFTVLMTVAFLSLVKPAVGQQPENRTAGTNQIPVKRFINSKTNLSGELSEKYIDFSFDYPASWEIRTAANNPGGRNFVEVQRRSKGELMESFNVGYFSHPETSVNLGELSEFLNFFARSLALGFSAFEKLSESEVRVGNHKGYELRFVGIDNDEESGDSIVWGRLILVPGAEKQNRGAFLVALGSSRAKELKSIKDVGIKGELPVILNSFQLGNKSQ